MGGAIRLYRSPVVLLEHLATQDLAAVGVIEREDCSLIATLTPFGPSVREYRSCSAMSAAAQSLQAGAPFVGISPLDWVDDVELEEFPSAPLVRVLDRPSEGSNLVRALQKFRSQSRSDVISRNLAGAATGRVFARAPVETRPFSLGDILLPVTARLQMGGHVVRWVSEGREAGVHIVIDRPLTDGEKVMLGRTRGVVRDFVHFDRDPSQSDQRFQVLAIEVGSEFMSAFPDGRLDRADIMPADLKVA